MIPFVMCFIQINTSIYSLQMSFLKNIFVVKLKICATYISSCIKISMVFVPHI